MSPIDKFVNPNFQNNLPENNVEPVPNNVEPVPVKSELPPKQSAGKLCGASSLQIYEFVLVFVKIDLLHFEHSICISLTCIC